MRSSLNHVRSALLSAPCLLALVIAALQLGCPPANRVEVKGAQPEVGADEGAQREVAPGEGAGLEVAADAAEPATSAILEIVSSELRARNVSRTNQHNEANPRFSADGRYLSFESRDGAAQAIMVADTRKPEAPVRRISSSPQQEALSLEDQLVGRVRRDESFNSQLEFLPDGSGYIFTGNSGTGAYRLYRGQLDRPGPEAISGRSKEDGHPAVSPDGRWLAYVSAREALGRLLLRELSTGEERPLTDGRHVDLYPVWSPDSRSIAFTSGANDNHDIFLIRDVEAIDAQPVALTGWHFDDLRPTFSPDGAWIAFYSNFSPSGEEKEWSILVVPADGSGPSKGRELSQLVVATNVVKDPDIGPAWLPRGRALVFARDLKKGWNPIFVVDTEAKIERRIHTATRMNHDLTCSKDGLLAFRAQVSSWDDIFVAPLVAVQ